MKIRNSKLEIRNSSEAGYHMVPGEARYHTLSGEAGVTLLLSILVLSGIALASASVGYFAIQEIRSSRAVNLTEPAITAAESGAERGIWVLNTAQTLVNCQTSISSTLLSNGTVSESCKSYRVVRFSLQASTTKNVYLWNPDDINGDISLLNYPYTSFVATNKGAAFTMTATITRLDGAAVGNVSIPPGATRTIPISPVAPGSEGRMRVALTTTGPGVIEVTSFNNSIERGIPGYPTVDAQGCSASVIIESCNSNQETFKRRVNITIPD